MSEVNNLAAKQRALLEQFNALQNPNNVYRVPGRTNTDASNFPVQLGGYNGKEDQKWSIRSQLVDQNTGVVGGVGQAIAPEEYFSYIQSKEEELSANSFIAWVMNQVDLSTPASAAWWYSHYPWLKQLRLDYAKKQHDLDWKLTELEINGAQNDEDMMVIYALETGRLKAPDTPTWKLYSSATGIQDNYVAGLFSPMANPARQTPAPAHLIPWAHPLQTQFATAADLPYTPQATLASIIRRG